VVKANRKIWQIIILLASGRGFFDQSPGSRKPLFYCCPFRSSSSSGGVSQTEREILNERGKGYTLKLIFSSKGGEYLSNAIVKVFDQKNRNILLTVANGPWLFIDLPNGMYKIEASFRADRKEVSQIKIEKGKQKVFQLRWHLKEPPGSG